MTPTPLAQVHDEPAFGGKAVQLASALRAGLPVPDGVALDVDLATRVAAGGQRALAACAEVFEALGADRVAARSSAVGEDSAGASFAGVHLSRLNVLSTDELLDAVAAIVASASTPLARDYRARLDIAGAPRMAVLIQPLIDADCAGVMFTRNPVDGADERIIEAAWGLGETVVGGIAEPDRYRMRRGGAIVSREIGDKDVQIVARPAGGTEASPVIGSRRGEPCLSDDRLAALDELAQRCEALFAGAHDIEWAFRGERLFLLQRRAVTR
jgi:pyruvate,water dikinase